MYALMSARDWDERYRTSELIWKGRFLGCGDGEGEEISFAARGTYG